VRVKLDGKATNLSTGIYLKPDEWDRKKSKVKLRNEQAFNVNTHLKQLEEKIFSIMEQVGAKDNTISLEKIKLILRDKVGDVVSLISLVDYFINHAESNPNYSTNTIRHYKSFKNKMLHFLSHKYSLTDFDLKNLNFEFVIHFEKFLSNEYNNRVNTVTKNIKRLKAIINTGIKLGWLKDNPFKNYQCKSEPSQRQFLTREELMAVRLLDLGEDENLALVRDIFLFMAYTGISYSDLIRLKGSNVTVINGREFIQFKRRKTKELCTIPLLTVAKQLIEKYKGSVSCIITETLLPGRTNQSLNRRLKIIKQKAGINKNLSCHIARHTFATISLENSVPIETVSKALGHTNIRTTQLYAKVTELKMYTDYSFMNTFFNS